MQENLNPISERTLERPIETRKELGGPEKDVARRLLRVRNGLEDIPTKDWPDGVSEKLNKVIEILSDTKEHFELNQARPSTLREVRKARKLLTDISFDLREIDNKEIIRRISGLDGAFNEAESLSVVEKGEDVWRGTDKGEVLETVSNELVLVAFEDGSTERVRQSYLKTAEEIDGINEQKTEVAA